MKLAFLGKGGSGKSSVSTQMALYLNKLGKEVLAIDADHNMDLSYNLTNGEIGEINYFSGSLVDFNKSVDLSPTQKYFEAFLRGVNTRFSLDPLSEEIEKFSKVIDNGIRLMTAGPQTGDVMYGKMCSHGLSTPLKILLPLLEMKDDHATIIDEKAGADGVSTGIVTGIDVGVIVCEPAFHSVKAAKQISELMDFYETPYVFVGNKVNSDEDKEFIEKGLDLIPVAYLGEEKGVKYNPSEIVSAWENDFKNIYENAKSLNRNDSLQRTINKFRKNEEYMSR